MNNHSELQACDDLVENRTGLLRDSLIEARFTAAFNVIYNNSLPWLNIYPANDVSGALQETLDELS